MPRRLLLIINPAAASSRNQSGRLDRLIQTLSAMGHTLEIRRTQRAEEAIQIAEEAMDFDVVIAVGGDGTVNEVATGLMHLGSRAPILGIAPFGTGNDMAQIVGTAQDDDFLDAMHRKLEQPMDLMAIHCRGLHENKPRAALLFGAVGFAAELLKQTTPRVKRWFGPKLCYSVGFFRALLTYRAPRIHARTHGVEVCEPMLVAYAANAPHAGAGMMQLAPDASLTDGLMNLCLIRQTSRFEAAGQFPRLLRGAHIGHPKVRYFTGTSLDLDSETALEVAADGELIGHTPARFQLIPKGLRVVGQIRVGSREKSVRVSKSGCRVTP